MSYTPIPKNLLRDAGVLVFRKADFYTLSTDAKPVPSTEQLASAENLYLVEYDTGNRYIWNYDRWHLTHLKGAINIHEADVHNIPINQYFHNHTGTITTLTVATAVGNTGITVASSAGFAVGDSINFYIVLTGYHLEAKITAIPSGTTITLDRPIDSAFPVGTFVELVLSDMAVIGSLASPVSYVAFPPAGTVWHITRVLIALVHGTAGDLGLFGDLAPLTNGVVFRTYINGTFNTFTNWKSSADMKEDMYDVTFDFRSGGGGVYGTSAKGDLKAIGVAARLDGDTGDYLEILIQDPLAALNQMRIKAQGHEEKE